MISFNRKGIPTKTDRKRFKTSNLKRYPNQLLMADQPQHALIARVHGFIDNWEAFVGGSVGFDNYSVGKVQRMLVNMELIAIRKSLGVVDTDEAWVNYNAEKQFNPEDS